jgi:hypothetical protein
MRDHPRSPVIAPIRHAVRTASASVGVNGVSCLGTIPAALDCDRRSLTGVRRYISSPLAEYCSATRDGGR